ncbi:MAG: DNA mismatch repair protein MutS [Planctomycetes bacterium]|nr:DNA mismatch repair protein MutS [Planctomycetota bacterium]
MRSTYLEKDVPGRSSSGATTPMMEQFWRAKKAHPDALLFFRMGDFYELFHEDAKTVSRELGLTLTARSKGEDAIPMAGVPVRSVDGYLMRLVAKGFKVAICEQLQDPRFTKGVVDRGVVRVVTSGTLTEEDALRSREHNYLASLFPSGDRAGLAWVDLSTGRFQVMEVERASLVDEIARIAPAELLWSSDLRGDESPAIVELRTHLGPRVSERDPWRFEREASLRALLSHFRVASLEGFGVEHDSPIVCAAGALVEYLQETQKSACQHVLRLERIDPSRFLVLDRATSSCLELFRTQRDGKEEGALIAVLDATCTPMGGRRLRDWLAHPLREAEPVLHRQRAVAELHGAPFVREELREKLSGMLDVERLAAKIATLRAHARDLRGLADSLAAVAPIREQLASSYSALLCELRDRLDPLTDLVERIRGTLADDPPLALREGGLIRSGVSAELDELHTIQGDGKSWMARFQAEESKRANLPGLKIGFNSVFGYFIEIPKGQVDRVPANYIRKQTIKGGERYITPELKEYEDKVLHAEEKSHDLEYELFVRLRDDVAKEIPRILATAEAIAVLDVLAALAQRAVENRYVAPAIDDGDVLRIVDGRHPVVERNPRGEAFVPNDSRLNRSDRLITILTGPNMAGKSTYIRQTALIVLLAQIGSFVPASEARVGIVDRIFTRIGAADDIGRNASTFMVEMLEIANILNNATSRSLVVLDEVGRGTSTFDGLALAWAIVEHLHEKVRARALFATHYHQLTDLATRLKGVCNMNVAVREWHDEIVFLHKIVDGGTDRSYGIHVARLAGVPRDVITRAKEILGDIERDAEDLAPRIARRGAKAQAGDPPAGRQLGLWEAGQSAVEAELASVDLDKLTPIEALLLLRELKQLLP